MLHYINWEAVSLPLIPPKKYIFNGLMGLMAHSHFIDLLYLFVYHFDMLIVFCMLC